MLGLNRTLKNILRCGAEETRMYKTSCRCTFGAKDTTKNDTYVDGDYGKPDDSP